MKHIKYICFICIMLPVFFNFTFGQTSSFKLPSNTNTSAFSVLSFNSTNLFTVLGDGKIGIGVSSPSSAELEIGGTNGLLVTGTIFSGSVLSLGSGTRMHWYPKKAAFRAGRVTGTQWDDGSIGDYSFAIGYNTTASGGFSFAAGYTTTASASYSFAAGYTTTASGLYSFATGYNTTASASYSFAAGYTTTASASYSFASGSGTLASGLYSLAMGRNTTASGDYSTALGAYVSTNSNQGAFIIGDKSTTTTTSNTTTNQMMMRFAGGYMFYTKSDISVGAQLLANATAWSSISDSTKKENFLYADGKKFLNGISKLRLGSWNYKTQDPKIYRHYGPMAQDIYYYFGNDKYGTIGVDTLLNTLDMDGIEMIALQALVKRTDELRKIVKIQQEEISELKKMKAEFTALKNVLTLFINNTSPNVKSKLTMNK